MPRYASAPKVRLPRRFRLPAARRFQLRNGLPVLAVEGATRPILRIELLFRAGRSFEPARAVGRIANLLPAEGTQHRSAAELEAYFEHYGTSLALSRSIDMASLAIYTIHPHLEAILPVLAEVLMEPAWQQSDLDRLVKRSKQSLREAHSRADYLADVELSRQLYGPDHPYGYGMTADAYDALTMAQLKHFHHQAYSAQNGVLLLAGQVDDRVEQLMDRYLGQLPVGVRMPDIPFVELPFSAGRHHIERPHSRQTLIRRSYMLGSGARADMALLEVLNTALGGYFGSRLMKNIREEKGYTYGIDSELETQRFADHLLISADVANENADKVLQEIELEIKKLQQQPLPEEELEVLRAYLLGNLIGEVDGPINTVYRYRQDLLDGIHHESFDDLVETVVNLQAADLMDIAQRYLGRPQQCVDVTVGGAA